MNVFWEIVSTVEALARSLSAVSFAFTRRGFGVNERARRGSPSAAAICFARPVRSMSRPNLECVTRTRRSVIFSCASRAGRCRRSPIVATKALTADFLNVTTSGTSTGRPAASRPA